MFNTAIVSLSQKSSRILRPAAVVATIKRTVATSSTLPKILQRRSKLQWQTQKSATTFALPLSRTLSTSSAQAFDKATEIFPGALTNADLVQKITTTLEDAGYDNTKVLVATSLCCDEVNRPLELDLSEVFTHNFNFGGLAGFPFGGATSFGAMAAHIPDGGSCLVIYGPHVGVDSTGAVGTVERRGKENGGSCCGSAVAASNHVSDVWMGDVEETTMPDDVLDAQQRFVEQMLQPYAEQLENAEDKMVQLPHSLFYAQSGLMKRIVDQSAGAVADGDIALLGGIQINTPPDFQDYFLPLRFDVFNNKGDILKQLW